MRAFALTSLVLCAATARAESKENYDVDEVWVDARLSGNFFAGSGGLPAFKVVADGARTFRADYSYQRGSVGFDLDAHLPHIGFGSAMWVAPTPMFRLHFTFGGADQVVLPEGTQAQLKSPGDLGYVLALGDGVQLFRRKSFLLLAYFLVGLDGNRRWYNEQSFLWAGPMLCFGGRALYETARWRVRGGYEAQPPFFGRVEHRLEAMVGFRPFEGGHGPFFGLRLYAHFGQTPVAEQRTQPASAGMSETQLGVGVEVVAEAPAVGAAWMRAGCRCAVRRRP